MKRHLIAFLVLCLFTADGLYLRSQGRQAASIDITTPSTTQIVGAISGQSVYIEGFGLTIAVSSASAQTVQFVYGTGTNCATGATVLTGALTGNTTSPINLFPYAAAQSFLFNAPASQAVCIRTTGSQAVEGWVTFRQ